jgi:hypothetical protein
MKFGDNLALRDFVSDIKSVLGKNPKEKTLDAEVKRAGDSAAASGDGRSESPNPFDTEAAMVRIRQSLANMEEGGEGAALEPNHGLAAVDEGSSLLVTADTAAAEKPEETGGKKTGHFRPRNSRLHR